MKLTSKIFFVIIISIIFWGCYRDTEIAKVGTAKNTTIDWDKAELEVHIKHNDSYSRPSYERLSKYGVCYSKEASIPTVNNNTKSISYQSDFQFYDDNFRAYKVTLTKLEAATTYYWRAFIQKDYIVVYGDVQSFTTLSKLPKVSTSNVTNITSTSATLSGYIQDIGDPAYTSKGICYSISENPTTSNSKVEVPGSGSGSFSGTASSLSPNTTYYIRAYIINSGGIAYGDQRSFTTLPTLPTVSTSDVKNIKDISATLCGNVTNVGMPAYTARGLCYSTTSQYPTTIDSKITIIGNGTGNFEGTAIDLKSNTTYYVRAYATNSAGTAYGNMVSFKTGILPYVGTSSPTNITSTSAILGGYIYSIYGGVGNPPYTMKGICYSTSQNPTTNDLKVEVEGTGIGQFEGIATSLIPNTTYYVRAYATSSIGTSYGEQRSFKTKQ